MMTWIALIGLAANGAKGYISVYSIFRSTTMPPLKIALLAFALVSPLVTAASFNCAKAVAAVEKMVCADPELSRLDDYLNGSYQLAVARVGDKFALRQWQRAWLKSNALNDCTSAECVKLAYGTRVKLLDDAIKSPWNGHYERYYNGKPDRNAAEIVLVASTEGTVIGEGSTLWMGPNAANGQVNVGEFGGVGKLNGGTLRFETDDCRVTAKLKGGVLTVEDNNVCNGHNATFAGDYRRK